jgi:catechol 2,3-dioxygenase-like lactoylglutathione lyase family enzyme
MKPHVSAITLGVKDLGRAKQFYGEGLGWAVDQDYPEWVSFSLGDGSSALGLYAWDALAADAGVPSDGNGFRGVTLSYIVSSQERVDEILAEAKSAGGDIVKPAQAGSWGGYLGYFADPDGYLWKVGLAEGEQSFVAE